MLLEARRAGEHLLKAKEQVRHGEFKPWIERNCAFSYSTAKAYMQTAKKAARCPFDLDTSLRQFLGIEDAKPSIPTPTDLSQDDASHALKLQALVERGATEGERDVAQGGPCPLGAEAGSLREGVQGPAERAGLHG